MAFSAHKDKEAVREIEEPTHILNAKLDQLADMVRASKHFVTFTGAGISTSAGIPDFRGPEGVWTLEAEGRTRSLPTIPTLKAVPTRTHMSLVTLQRRGILKHLISQNCDGLHRKSGFDPTKLSELHGNGNMEECEDCSKRFYRDYSCYRLGRGRDHYTGRHCPICNGRLLEWTIDFGQNLPEDMLTSGFANARQADLHLVLGSSLTVSPACNMPEATGKKQGGSLVVVNLQKTPLDKLCALRIFARADVVMEGLMQRLGINVDPWTLHRKIIVTTTPTSLSFRGVDPFQRELPADLFKEVRVMTGPKSGQAFKSEPYSCNLPQGTDKVMLALRWQGHYAEPDLCVPLLLDSHGEREVSMIYHPFEQRWVIEGAAAASVPREVRPKHTCIPCNDMSGRDWGTTCVVEGNTLVVFGGTTRSNKSEIACFKLERDMRISSLRVLSNPIASRWGHSAVVSPRLPSRVVVFGGWDSKCQYNDVHEFNSETGDIRAIPTRGDIPPFMSQHSACLIDDVNMLVVGGAWCTNGPYQFNQKMFVLNLESMQWTDVTDTMTGDVPTPRAQASMVRVGTSNKVILAGGWSGRTTNMNDWYTLDTTTRKWTQGSTPLPWTPSLVEPSNFRVPGCRPCLTASPSGSVVVWASECVAQLVDNGNGALEWTTLNAPPLVCHSTVSYGNGILALGGHYSDDGRSHEMTYLEM